MKSEDIVKLGTGIVLLAETALKLLTSIKTIIAQNGSEGEDVEALVARIEKAQASISELPPVEELDANTTS